MTSKFNITLFKFIISPHILIIKCKCFPKTLVTYKVLWKCISRNVASFLRVLGKHFKPGNFSRGVSKFLTRLSFLSVSYFTSLPRHYFIHPLGRKIWLYLIKRRFFFVKSEYLNLWILEWTYRIARYYFGV